MSSKVQQNSIRDTKEESKKYLNANTQIVSKTENGDTRNNYGTVAARDDAAETPALFPQVLALMAACMSQVNWGAIIGLSGVVLPALMDHESEDLTLDDHQASLFTSVVFIGAMVGCLLSSPLMVWLGQRVTLMVVLPVSAVAWIVLAFTPSIGVLIAMRSLLGAIAGVCGTTTVTYVAEISHSSVRGGLTGSNEMFGHFGCTFVYLLGSTSLGWRYTSLVCGIVSIIPLVIFVFVPNSPRWLAVKNRYLEAEQALQFFRGKHYNINGELKDIIEQVENSSYKTITLRSQLTIFTDSYIRKNLIFLLFLFFTYQFNGNYTIIVYSTTIFQAFNSSINSYTSTIVVGCVRIASAFMYISLADKVGRRPVFLCSTVLSSLFMGAAAVCTFVLSYETDVSFLYYLPLLSIAFFIFFTGNTLSTLVLVRSEILPTSVRLTGVPIILACSYFASFLSAHVFPLLLQTVGIYGIFIIYALVGLTITIVGGFFLPETKSKSLEEIEKHMGAGK